MKCSILLTIKESIRMFEYIYNLLIHLSKFVLLILFFMLMQLFVWQLENKLFDFFVDDIIVISQFSVTAKNLALAGVKVCLTAFEVIPYCWYLSFYAAYSKKIMQRDF